MNEKMTPLDHILVPQKNGTGTHIHDEEQIYEEILQANKIVLQSAQHTVPASIPFRGLFGDFGDTKTAHNLIYMEKTLKWVMTYQKN